MEKIKASVSASPDNCAALYCDYKTLGAKTLSQPGSQKAL